MNNTSPSIIDLPEEIRFAIWSNVPVEDYGNIACTCRLLRDDRARLDPTRVVQIRPSVSPNFAAKFNRSRLLLQERYPVTLVVLASEDDDDEDYQLNERLNWIRQPVVAVTALDVSLSEQHWLSEAAIASCFPNLRELRLPTTIRGSVWNFSILRELNHFERLVWRNSACTIRASGDGLHYCHHLRDLDITGSTLVKTSIYASSLFRTEFLAYCHEFSLRRVCLKDVNIIGQGRLSQDRLTAFVRRHASTLEYLESDLTPENRRLLREQYPNIQFR